ncbi:MAG: TIGR00730 family Rossman fold protein [Granulosicoccus sp.]
MTALQSLCVYCGSSSGASPQYVEVSWALADVMLERDITLVYGGAHVGIMGAIADRLMLGGGRVIGVIPEALVKFEVAHDGLTELHVVADMHARKAMMADKSDAFVALPGGLGTLEELFEVLTWSQLGIHGKPCGLLNIAGFYDSLLQFLDHAAGEAFMTVAHRELLISETEPEILLNRFDSYVPAVTSKLTLGLKV